MRNDTAVTAEHSEAGGTDVWSSIGDGGPNSADHLVVFVHGILGSTANWEYAANEFATRLADKVIVHCSEKNIFKLTLDGVDVMGERLAEEVIDVVNRWPGLKKISFVAHSVGGLVARYTIGRLFRPPARGAHSQDDASGGNLCGTIAGLEPINFITLATPHLGSRGNKQVPFLFGFTPAEKFASLIIHWIFGRTGKHLFLTDSDDGKPPLVMRMIDDCDDLYFMSGLRAFKRRVAYSNVDYDHIVGWRTSSIRRHLELPEWEDSLSEKYPHIVHEELTSPSNDETTDASPLNENSDMLEEKIVTALTSMSWERVDVSFHASSQRFYAHSVIQVKDTVSHSEGADVIKHMIDRFVT